jgi:photosystem II stability/assembly factor-like uncharacterized protein
MESELSTRNKRDTGRYRVRSKVSIFLILALCALAGCGSRSNQQSDQSTQFTAMIQGGTRVLTTVPGALSNPHMISPLVGWATSWDLAGDGSYAILRTTDGGHHWKSTLKCKPTQPIGKGFVASCSTDFHSASIATVTAPEYDTSTRTSSLRIFHTADGGATWQSSVLVAGYLETQPTFVDALHGWALVTENFPGPDPGSSYIGQNISLYRTSDGGRSWQRVAHGPATSQLNTTSDDAYGVAPLTANARMEFTSVTTGWLDGFTRNQNWLYVTHDGGVTWRQVSLSPTGSSYHAPVFFTPQDGVLTTTVTGGTNALGETTRTSMLYITHDGGATWQSSAVPFDITTGAFIDMTHAWALVTHTTISGSLTATATGFTPPATGNPDDFTTTTLDMTGDDWQHWTEIRLPTTFKQIYDFDFVSPTTGWALAENRTHSFPAPGGGRSKGDVIVMLQTTDGGHTWQQISRSQV